MSTQQSAATETARKVIALLRVSTKKQADDKKTGFERQARDVRFTASQLHLEIVETFKVIVSGTVLVETEDYRKLKTAVSRPGIAGLVIPSIDRLTRSTDYGVLDSLIKPLTEITTGKANKLLFVKTDALDMTTPDGRNKLYDQAKFAEQERLSIRYRTTEGRDTLRLDPSACVDLRPTGINFKRHVATENNGVYSYDAAAKARMAEAFQRVLDGETLNKIAKELGFSNASALRKLLQSRLWTGYREKMTTWKTGDWDDARQKSKRHITALTETERKAYLVRIDELADDPCVSVETFEAVQDKLAVNRSEWMRKDSTVKDLFLVPELLHCGCCGRKMYAKQKKNKNKTHLYYISARAQRGTGEKCEFGSVTSSNIDDAIRLQLRVIFGTDAALKTAVMSSQTPTETTKKQTAVDRLEQDVKKLERKITNIENVMFENGATTNGTATLKQTKVELETAQASLRTMRNDLENSMTDENIDRMVSRLRADFRWFERLEIEDQKRMLSRYVEAVVLHKNTDPLGREIGVDLKFKVAVVEDDAAPVKAVKPTPFVDDGKAVRVKSDKRSIGYEHVPGTPKTIGGAESLEETIKRLRSGSHMKTAS